MKALNFTLKNANTLLMQGYQLDLALDYDFTGFQPTSTSAGTVNSAVLRWQRCSSERTDQSLPAAIELYIEGITKYQQQAGRSNASPEDKRTLDEIAYLSAEDWCDGPFLMAQMPEPAFDWVFMFESDLWLIFNASTIEARVFD